MKIETKFDVGQEVFHLVKESKFDGCFMRQTGKLVVADESSKIKSITAWIYSNTTTIVYNLSDGSRPSEDHCFLTRAAAEAEIQRRKA